MQLSGFKFWSGRWELNPTSTSQKPLRGTYFRPGGDLDLELRPGTAMYKSGPRHQILLFFAQGPFHFTPTLKQPIIDARKLHSALVDLLLCNGAAGQIRLIVQDHIMASEPGAPSSRPDSAYRAAWSTITSPPSVVLSKALRT